MGGITANTRSDNNAEYVIDQCYVSGLLQCTHYGACIGGLVGEPTWAGTTKVTITNNIISNLNVKMLGTHGAQGSAVAEFLLASVTTPATEPCFLCAVEELK